MASSINAGIPSSHQATPPEIFPPQHRTVLAPKNRTFLFVLPLSSNLTSPFSSCQTCCPEGVCQ